VTLTRRHALALLAAAGCRRRGSGFDGYALIAAAGSRSVAIIDLLAFARKGSIPLPFEPTALVAHPDSAARRAYAVMAGHSTIAEISPDSPSILRRLSLPAQPHTVRIAAQRLYWISPNRNWLGIIDLKEWKPLRTIALAAPPVDLDVSHSRPFAAVTLSTGALQFIPTDGGKPFAPVDAAAELGAIRFRSDGGCVLVAEPKSNAIAVFDTTSRQKVVQLQLALSPERLWMKGDGGQLFVTGAGVDGVAIVYPYRTEVAQTFLSGRRPGEMADSRTPDYLFVSNPEAGSVTVFSIETQKVVAVTGVGASPGPIAITPDQQYALVVNRGSGDLAVIRIAAITPGREKRAPLFTMVPVGAQPCGITVFGA
jgi:hypothetical protein